ncbi:unnamed protein product [Leptidea sinapis]|uniref:Uncharacterized protein n=1 Tax=Leptidea sinapis TaxID=189913 RepID=A0A5E4QKU3_9NEOP|nr:unnamed protein product [Leptidea sinapis]
MLRRLLATNTLRGFHSTACMNEVRLLTRLRVVDNSEFGKRAMAEGRIVAANNNFRPNIKSANERADDVINHGGYNVQHLFKSGYFKIEIYFISQYPNDHGALEKIMIS